jgi:hypothetical protein
MATKQDELSLLASPGAINIRARGKLGIAAAVIIFALLVFLLAH